jgi:hypothetical protein
MYGQTMQRLLLVDAERFGNRIVAVGDHGYIVITDDFGKTWRRAKAPAEPMLTAIDFLDDTLGLAVGHDSVILHTADRGETWTQVFSAASEQRPLLDVLYVKKDFAIAVAPMALTTKARTSRAGPAARSPRTTSTSTWSSSWVKDACSSSARRERSCPPPIGARRGHRSLRRTRDRSSAASSPRTAPWSPSECAGASSARRTRANLTAIENASTASLIGGEKLPDGSIVLAGASGMALASRDNGMTFQPLPTGTTRSFAKAIQGANGEVLLLGEAGPRIVKPHRAGLRPSNDARRLHPRLGAHLTGAGFGRGARRCHRPRSRRGSPWTPASTRWCR